MEQTGRPSTEQMAQVLDNAPVAILVSALESRELLYCNRLAKESLQLDGDGGKLTCYRAAGFQEPCPFCHAGQMSSCELLERIYHHPLNGRAYQLSGKLIDWAGQPAHIEYILDVTDRQREFLLLYYAQGLNMRQIGERLGVDKSTVSRTIKRGEARLQRCLRYGAEAYLRSMGP